MKKIFFYIETYGSNFPCYVAHEVSHGIFILFFWMLGIATSFPKIVWARKASITINSDNTTSIQSTYLFIKWNSHRRHKIPLLIVCCSPILLTISLFIFSPIYMYLYYIANINTLWMSVGDINECERILSVYKRAAKIKKLK